MGVLEIIVKFPDKTGNALGRGDGQADTGDRGCPRQSEL